MDHESGKWLLVFGVILSFIAVIAWFAIPTLLVWWVFGAPWGVLTLLVMFLLASLLSR